MNDRVGLQPGAVAVVLLWKRRWHLNVMQLVLALQTPENGFEAPRGQTVRGREDRTKFKLTAQCLLWGTGRQEGNFPTP